MCVSGGDRDGRAAPLSSGFSPSLPGQRFLLGNEDGLHRRDAENAETRREEKERRSAALADRRSYFFSLRLSACSATLR